jgi:hypothetical protein
MANQCYMNARWTDSETGRFISLDPAQDGYNWYVYAGNNPTTNVDPTGLYTFPLFGMYNYGLGGYGGFGGYSWGGGYNWGGYGGQSNITNFNSSFTFANDFNSINNYGFGNYANNFTSAFSHTGYDTAPLLDVKDDYYHLSQQNSKNIESSFWTVPNIDKIPYDSNTNAAYGVLYNSLANTYNLGIDVANSLLLFGQSVYQDGLFDTLGQIGEHAVDMGKGLLSLAGNFAEGQKNAWSNLFRNPKDQLNSELNFLGRMFSSPQTYENLLTSTISGFLGKSLNVSKVGYNAAGKTPTIGSKLEYVFGKATGNVHNIERSQEMLRSLEKIGIYDNAAGRTYFQKALTESFYNSPGVVQANGRIAKDFLLMGSNGGVKVQAIWEETKLITVNIFGH